MPERNVLGVDIKDKDFAYSALTRERRVPKQGYLGQQVWVRERRLAERRALLQSLNALKKLKRMRHRQRDCVGTNMGQLVREIVLLAKRFDVGVVVAIGRLRRFKLKGRVIPFCLFRRTLEARCVDSGTMLDRVDPYHTSKWCSRCGAVGGGHDGRN